MKYRFIQYPRYVPKEEYAAAIARMTDRLGSVPGVRTVTQVGGTGTPGISDIDFFVVFDDNATVTINPVTSLTGHDVYLFTHNLFGTCHALAIRMEQYTFFGNYKVLHGKPFIPVPVEYESESAPMKVQVALEYLLKAWITIQTERIYGVIKIRNLFLVSKALLHDLALLEISSGTLWDVMQEMVQCRNRWFESPLPGAGLAGLVDRYAKALQDFLEGSLTSHKFWLPAGSQPLRHVRIKPGNSLKLESSGPGLPAFLAASHPKLFNLQHRLKKFTAFVPHTSKGAPLAVKSRHELFAEAVRYNRKNLPAFVPTAYGLNIFDRPQN